MNQLAVHFGLIPAVLYGELFWWGVSLATFYVFHGIGSGCGAHRYFTHRSFQAPRWAQTLMALSFTLASSGSVIGYVLIHHKHHKHADQAGDPHDPKRLGPFKTWLGILDKNSLTIDPRAYMRMRNDWLLRITHDYYFLIIAGYAAAMSVAFGWQGLVFLYALPAALQFHANSALIVLCHTEGIGYRKYQTADSSRNLNWLFRFWLLGEEMHNNHHYRPSSATMNIEKTWRDADPLSPVIQYFLSWGGNASAAK